MPHIINTKWDTAVHPQFPFICLEVGKIYQAMKKIILWLYSLELPDFHFSRNAKANLFRFGKYDECCRSLLCCQLQGVFWIYKMTIFAKKCSCFLARRYWEGYPDALFCGIITKFDLFIIGSFLSVNVMVPFCDYVMTCSFSFMRI